MVFRKGPVPLQKSVSVPACPPLCCCGLSMLSLCPCCGVNCDSLRDSNLSLLFIFTRLQAAPVNSGLQICVIYKPPWTFLKGKCPHPYTGSAQIELPLHTGHLSKDPF